MVVKAEDGSVSVESENSHRLPALGRLVPGGSYTVTIRAEYPNHPGMLGRVASLIGDTGGDISSIDLVEVAGNRMVRDITVGAQDADHVRRILRNLKAISGLSVRSASDSVFLAHLGGKIEVHNRQPVSNRRSLSQVYTPGVARVSQAIAADREVAWTLTTKKNTVAIVTDGSAILGLGDLGPAAALPVMEGKAMLFKEFANVDAWPICLDARDPDEIVRVIKALSPGFGGINLEDIAAPRCFEIEERLRESLDIPVFHDDQHGTAVVVLAALINALQVVGKRMQDVKVCISGAGAAGTACARMLRAAGVDQIVPVDVKGIVFPGRDGGEDQALEQLAQEMNPHGKAGTIHDAIVGADVFLGVSAGNVISVDDVRRMNRDPIVFALANPTPEIQPEAIEGIARVIATGRSDYSNQINNVLCFPGLFRGVLDVRASQVNESMKLAAARAIAGVVSSRERSEEYIIPSVFNPNVVRAVAREVAQAAQATGVARPNRRRSTAFL